jgi:hypothetical protein
MMMHGLANPKKSKGCLCPKYFKVYEQNTVVKCFFIGATAPIGPGPPLS